MTLLMLENGEGNGTPTPVLLPGKSHGRRSLVGCSPWDRKESDTTERLHFHFSLSCFGEGNGNPLQCSCLENPRDGGAWCVAVYGVAQGWHDWSDLAAAMLEKAINKIKSRTALSSSYATSLYTGLFLNRLMYVCYLLYIAFHRA